MLETLRERVGTPELVPRKVISTGTINQLEEGVNPHFKGLVDGFGVKDTVQ